MHPGQLTISVDQVVALVTEQVPDLAGRRVVRVEGAGTVHAVFRIGDAHAARFPLIGTDAAGTGRVLAAEAEAAGEFARACPFPAPRPVAIGRPGHGYPLPWVLQTWVPGTTARPGSHASSHALALDVARLVSALRARGTDGRCFSGGGRGGDLRHHDEWVGECIERSERLLDPTVMRSLWSRFRELPQIDPDAMCHGDLIPANLLVTGESLVGVIDTGGFRPADPALDLVVAWHLFETGPRAALRAELHCSDLQWERGAAWAFQQAIGAYWYYVGTNDAMADMGRTTIARIVSAFAGDGQNARGRRAGSGR